MDELGAAPGGSTDQVLCALLVEPIGIVRADGGKFQSISA